MISSSGVEIEELNEKADKVEKPEDAAEIMKQYEEILRTKRKGIKSIAYHQGKIFKRFREKEVHEISWQFQSKQEYYNIQNKNFYVD